MKKQDGFFSGWCCLFGIIGLLFTQTAASSSASPPKVLVSIRPLYGIAAELLHGVGEPQLFLEGSESPHTYALRPYDMDKIESADIVLWIGPAYEGFLAKVLTNAKSKHAVLTAQNMEGIITFPLRVGGIWGNHVHSHGHEDAHNHEHGGGGHHDATDGHLWLHPDNARVIARELAQHLSRSDPAHQAQYQENLMRLEVRLSELKSQLKAASEPLRSHPFIVFHDSYQYLERFLGLKTAGAVLIDPELPANAYHIEKLRRLLKARAVSCLFHEPQFDAAIVHRLREQAGCSIGQLDPLGTETHLSESHYYDTMRQLLAGLKGCLEGGRLDEISSRP